jgi:hypothetical protein
MSGFGARQQSYDRLLEKVAQGGNLTPTEQASMRRFEKELAELGLAPLDLPEIFATIEEAETYSGYKRRTIYKAVADGLLDRLSDGSFTREALDSWLALKGKRSPAQERAASGNDAAGEKETARSARQSEADYRSWRAQHEELKVKQLKGELISRVLINQEWVERANEFKTSLLLYNRRVSHLIAEIAGIEARLVDEIMDKEARQLLGTVCRKIRIYVD